VSRSRRTLPSRSSPLTLPVYLAFGLALIGLWSCSQEPHQGRIRIALATELGSFDPIDSGATAQQIQQRQVFEGLLEYDPNSAEFSTRSLLAESWSVSEDGLTWDFHIREDAEFFDPDPNPLWPGHRRAVQAQDVLDSWLRLADGGSTSPGWFALQGFVSGLDEYHAQTSQSSEMAQDVRFAAHQEGLSGIQVLSQKQLRVTLTRPEPTFLFRLASPYLVVYPYEAVQRNRLRFGDHPVGSGPYFLAEHTPPTRALYRNVPNWRESSPSVSEIELLTVLEGSTRTMMFERGEIDRLAPVQDSFAALIHADAPNAALTEKGVSLHITDTPDLSMVVFNMVHPTVGIIPGDDAGNQRRTALRRALALAFPYQQWDTVLRNNLWGSPAKKMLPPGLPETSSCASWPEREENLALAKSLLEEAGWGAEHPLPALRFELGGSDPATRDLGDLIQAGWQRLGIEVTPIAQSRAEFYRKLNSGEAQVFSWGWALDWPDSGNLLGLFHGKHLAPGPNKSNYRNPEWDATFEEFQSLPVGAARNALARSLVRTLNADMPLIPIDHRRSYLLLQPWLKVPTLNSFDPMPCRYFTLRPR